MAKVLDKPPGRMTVDQFLDWAMAQPDGRRYELVAGEVVAMVPYPPDIFLGLDRIYG
jgi:Uma2 family endonuclease